MNENIFSDKPDLDKLFEKYNKAPTSFVFAPLADACRKLGRLDEAMEICTQGLSHHPNYSTGRIVLGKLFYDKHDPDKAFDEFQKVLELDPHNLVALKFIGIILSERGEEEEAKTYFKSILALDPENKEIKAKLHILEETENEVMELKPVEDEMFEGKEIQLGDDEVESSDELATTTLADIFAAQGYKAKAIKIYNEVLKKDPDNAAVKEKLKKLSERATDEATLEKIVDESSTDASDSSTSDEMEEPVLVKQNGPKKARSGKKKASKRRVSKESVALEQKESTAPDDEKAEAHRGSPSTEDDPNIDQFKKWLQNMSD